MPVTNRLVPVSALAGGLVLALLTVPSSGNAVESVTVTVPADAMVAADTPVTVAVAPSARREVMIQARSTTNGWKRVAWLTTDSAGTGSVDWRPLTGDTYRVRAVVPAQAGSPRVVSPPQVVTADYGFTLPPEEELRPMTAGRLIVRPRADRRLRLAGYTIRVNSAVPARGFPAATGNRAPGLRISDTAGRTTWASDPGRSFALASRGSIDWFWRSQAGAFWPDVSRDVRLTTQTIDSVARRGDRVVVQGVLRGSGERAPYRLTLRPVRQSRGVTAMDLDLRVPRTASGDRITSVQLVSGRRGSTAVHGLGEQFRPFDLSGSLIPILVQEQGVTRGEMPAAPLVDRATWGAGNLNTSYAPWPSYVTAQNRSFELVDNQRSGAFAVADVRRAGQIGMESFQSRMTARVLAAGSPKSLMAARAAGSRRPELASWIQRGAVLGLQGGTDVVTGIVKDMQRAGTTISGVWLQDWVGRRVTGFGEQLWWTWQLNRVRYPRWNQMVRRFNDQGIKVMTYVNPFVIDADNVDGQPIKNYLKIGERKGYLVKNRLGNTYIVETIGFPTALVDLTNPKARDWFADIIADEVLGVGADGFMADFGEYLPLDSVLHTGTALQQHNRYPQLWAETVKEGCERGGVPDCVAFFRAGYTGTPKSAPLMWAGDQMVNYAPEDGMKNAVKGMLAGGVSGAPLWHSDIGGYTSVNAAVVDFVRPPNLNARWAEMQAFGPVMRSHETNRPRLNQQIYDTPKTRAQFARASRIYAALRPYRADVIDEAVRRGIPAMRHTWLVYPGTKAARSDLQFFLGDSLLVAPVYAESATTVDVTFPPGRWRHILTGRVYRGDRTTTVPAPIGTPAAFVRVGDPTGAQIVARMNRLR